MNEFSNDERENIRFRIRESRWKSSESKLSSFSLHFMEILPQPPKSWNSKGKIIGYAKNLQIIMCWIFRSIGNSWKFIKLQNEFWMKTKMFSLNVQHHYSCLSQTSLMKTCHMMICTDNKELECPEKRRKDGTVHDFLIDVIFNNRPVFGFYWCKQYIWFRLSYRQLWQSGQQLRFSWLVSKWINSIDKFYCKFYNIDRNFVII